MAFRIQLEYDHDAQLDGQHDPDREPVARFDHTPNSPSGHDIRDDGLHMDLYGPRGHYIQKTGFPYVPVDAAPEYCEQYLTKREDELVARYERKCGITGRWTTD